MSKLNREIPRKKFKGFGNPLVFGIFSEKCETFVEKNIELEESILGIPAFKRRKAVVALWEKIVEVQEAKETLTYLNGSICDCFWEYFPHAVHFCLGWFGSCSMASKR